MCSPRRFLRIACFLLYPIAAMAQDGSLPKMVRPNPDRRGFPVSPQPNVKASGQAAGAMQSVGAHADSTSEVFLLPNSCVGEAYQLDIEALLREKYRLKIVTTREAILQWSLVDGELPAGLTIRSDGKVAGTPETYREKPYVFSVSVVDRTVGNSAPLLIPLSVIVAPPRLRLARIEGPALVPIDNAASPSRGNENEPQASDVPTTPAPEGSREPNPMPEVRNNNHPPLPTEVTDAPSENRGFLSKIVSVVGFQDGGSGSTMKPKGCDPGSKANRLPSDEELKPLEGDTSTQNTCVEFTNLNTLKYRYEFNTKTTRTEGPDLSTLPFLPKITPTTAAAPAKANTPAPTTNTPGVIARSARMPGTDKNKKEADARNALEAELKLLDRRFNTVSQGLFSVEGDLHNVEELINQRITEVQNAHNKSVLLANAAGSYLGSGDTTTLLTKVGQTKTAVDTALTLDWPAADLTSVMNDLNELTRGLESLRFDMTGNQDISQEAWTEWMAANQDRYSRVRDRIAELKTKVTTISGGVIAFNEAKNVLSGWQLVLDNVDNQKAAAFTRKVFVSCHTDEAETKSNKLTISKTDRTTANATEVTRDVLTVNCYSRVAFTAGFNFSTLDEKEFSVVNSAGTESGTTVKKFGFTNRSSFRPNPLALVNIRFTDQPTINWHASFGAVVDLKGQTGTDVEAVAGVSFSLRRLIFITPFALHFGRVNKLAGGFKEGDVVPESIATPPIEKAWKVGYTGGITFRIAP